MNSITALRVARARQDDLLRAAERRPQRTPIAPGGRRSDLRRDVLRWIRFPRLVGSRA
jgi:hypothetical protein